MTMRIRIRFGFVWTGNTLRMDGNIFESGNKKLRIQKYPDRRVDGALFGRENRLEIYWCVFCSILKIFSTHELKPR